MEDELSVSRMDVNCYAMPVYSLLCYRLIFGFKYHSHIIYGLLTEDYV
jgi:hypothetical protein